MQERECTCGCMIDLKRTQDVRKTRVRKEWEKKNRKRCFESKRKLKLLSLPLLLSPWWPLWPAFSFPTRFVSWTCLPHFLQPGNSWRTTSRYLPRRLETSMNPSLSKIRGITDNIVKTEVGRQSRSLVCSWHQHRFVSKANVRY